MTASSSASPTTGSASRPSPRPTSTSTPRNDVRRLFKATFHYTDPTRTGPDTDKVRAHCRRRAKFHYTDTDTDPTRTRPDPHGPARTFFLRRNSVHPCGSGRVRVVEFSYYRTATQLHSSFVCLFYSSVHNKKEKHDFTREASSITPSLFHPRLEIFLFCKSFPP